MKAKLSAAAIVSTVAIATSVVLSSATPSVACMYRKARDRRTSWFQSPLSAVIALSGMALQFKPRSA